MIDDPLSIKIFFIRILQFKDDSAEFIRILEI